jgi:hypothetical protein
MCSFFLLFATGTKVEFVGKEVSLGSRKAPETTAIVGVDAEARVAQVAESRRSSPEVARV